MKYVQKILKFSFLLIFVVQFVSGGTTGKISGKVVDEKNQPLIGCNYRRHTGNGRPYSKSRFFFKPRIY